MSKKLLAAALAASAVLWSAASQGADPLGSAADARAMLDRAVVAMKSDEGAALKQFNDTNDKKFRDRDLFVYCFSLADGKFTAYEMPALLNADIRQFKLYGEPMGQRAYDAVHDAQEGTVASIEYNMPKPGTKTPVPKEALEARVGNQGCGVSYYK